MFDNLWVEKYRPSTIDDIVLSSPNRSFISDIASDGRIPNLLFVGKPGIGKTSLAKIIVNNILECQYLYINASDENGIDTVRTKITNFSKVMSIDGNIKVIILDEVDGLTLDAQRALRNTMEEYSQFVRFILTANYHHKVIPALQSRCQNFDLTPDIQGFYDRCNHVLSSENIEYEFDDKLKNILKKYYPDLRRVINELQKLTVNNKIVFDTHSENSELIDNVVLLLKANKVFDVRKYVIRRETDFGSDYPVLLTELFNKIDNISSSTDKKREGLLCVSEHIYRSAFVLDQEINFYSCIVSLSKILS